MCPSLLFRLSEPCLWEAELFSSQHAREKLGVVVCLGFLERARLGARKGAHVVGVPGGLCVEVAHHHQCGRGRGLIHQVFYLCPEVLSCVQVVFVVWGVGGDDA